MGWQMKKLYKIRRGTDLNWGIYSTGYNIRIAVFNPNTEADRKQIEGMMQAGEIKMAQVLDIYELLDKAQSLLVEMTTIIFDKISKDKEEQ